MNEDFLTGRILFGSLLFENGGFAGLNPASEIGHRAWIGRQDFQSLSGLHLVDFFFGLDDGYWAVDERLKERFFD